MFNYQTAVNPSLQESLIHILGMMRPDYWGTGRYHILMQFQFIGVMVTGPNNPEAIGSQFEASKGL